MSAATAIATLEEDASLLPAWAAAFQEICGAAVRRDDWPVSELQHGQRLTFPDIFTPPELIGGTGHFRHQPAMAEQVRRLGFDWHGERLLTVPAAGAFNARLSALGCHEAGFRMAYANGMQPKMPLGRWLLSYLSGIVTVLVNAPAYYRALASAPPYERRDARWGLMSVAHDLSVHAINYHLIPHAALCDLAARIRTAIPERCEQWSQPQATAPLTLTYFYDNDLNRYSYAVWCACERPEDFGAIFSEPRNYAQLTAALATRLAETAAGIGDVEGGDFDDMGPIAQTRFEIRAAG